jgi:hypothetical protein
MKVENACPTIIFVAYQYKSRKWNGSQKWAPPIKRGLSSAVKHAILVGVHVHVRWTNVHV